ncbi:unnamed protein product [Cochlearia groenlandica]
MEFTQISLISLIFIIISITFLFKRSIPKLNLPPSPAISLPVIGHLHLLKPRLHRSLLSFSHSLGNAPIFHLRLGNRLVYVVSSRSLAEECFTTKDVVLADRPVFIVSKHIGYNATHMVAAPYGDHWRNLRRIAAGEIFSSQRLNMFLYIRKDEIQRLISCLCRDSLHKFAEVEMKSLLGNLSSNNIIRMVAGKRYYDDGTQDNDEAKRVRQLVSGLTGGASAGNPADYITIVRWVTKFEKNIKNIGNGMDAILQRLVDEKRSEKEKGHTMIDHLLSLQKTQPEYYTDVTIKGMILSMISAGSDTSAVTLEWAMSSLLNHPEILMKVRSEIDDKIGLNRLIEESDIVNLHYLQKVVSETLRLYPAVPLLLPHMAREDCKVAGYDMPRGTILLANAWAMHRDPNLWEEHERFNP